jgi:hypothetical protein
MQKKYFIRSIIIILVLFITSNSCFTQTTQIGFGGYFYKQVGHIIISHDPGSASGTVQYLYDIDESSGVPGIFCSYYHPFYKPNKSLSAGLQGGFAFYAYYEAPSDVMTFTGQKVGTWGGTDFITGYQVPIMAMARIGSLSTSENEKKIGGAIGFGIIPMGFTLPYDRGMMIPFSFCAELNFKNAGLRFDMPLRKYQSYFKSYTGDIPKIKNSFFSITIIWGNTK